MRRAFSLVELLISIALGLVILGAAWSAVRAASQSVTAAQHLAVSNALIGEGIHSAFEEIDWWDAYDSRGGDPAKQRLRDSRVLPVPSAEGAVVAGLPFSPFKRAVRPFAAVWPDASYGHGWQDDERLWALSADNELTWWPGNKAESQETDCRFGRYPLLGLSRLPNEAAVVIDGGTGGSQWGGVGGWQPRNGGAVYGTVAWGPEDAAPAPGADVTAYRHATPGWLYNQMHGLGDAIGWYGMIDYLPANTIICYSKQLRPIPGIWNDPSCAGDSTDAAGRPIYMIKTYANQNLSWQFVDKPYFFLQTFAPNWSPHGVDFLTSYGAYGLIPSNGNLSESNGGPPLTTEQLTFYNRSVARFETTDLPPGDRGSNVFNTFMEPAYPTAAPNLGSAAMTAFMQRTTTSSALLGLQPAYWPRVLMSTSRYLRLCRFSSQVSISWIDPVSGNRADLRFTALGTTLRGARRQRGLDQ